MRLLPLTVATALAALVFVAAGDARWWLDLGRSTAKPSQTVHGQAVSPCSVCGPALLFLVHTSNAGLQLLKSVPRDDPRFYFGALSLVVPRGWHWRTLRGPEPGSRIVQLSNASFRVRRGLDPIKDMGKGTFVLTFVPLGNYGSATAPTIGQGDFLARSDPSRPRGHALARHSYCSPGGRCFSIALEYGSDRVPDGVLASVNRVLRSLRAAPLREKG